MALLTLARLQATRDMGGADRHTQMAHISRATGNRITPQEEVFLYRKMEAGIKGSSKIRHVMAMAGISLAINVLCIKGSSKIMLRMGSGWKYGMANTNIQAILKMGSRMELAPWSGMMAECMRDSGKMESSMVMAS